MQRTPEFGNDRGKQLLVIVALRKFSLTGASSDPTPVK